MHAEERALAQYADMAELLARVDDDRELLVELLKLFQEDYPGLRDALQRAVETGDGNQIEQAAHKLKGMLASLSLKPASRLAADVETAARAGDTKGALEAMAELDREQTGLAKAVASFLEGGQP